MYKFESISLHNREKWDNVISNSKHYDFYHTSCYHKIESKSGKAELLFATDGNNHIAIPLILREIANTDLFDATSVYGYCGPITNLSLENIPLELIKYFQDQAIKYFKSNRVVSVFSRLHPLIDSSSILKDFGTVRNVNQTIAIDLTEDLDAQRRKYRKSNRYDINKLRRTTYDVVKASTKNQIESFVSIYIETMKRVEAKESYFFDREYFTEFIENSCFKSDILLAVKDSEIAAGAIFTVTNGIMQYHLAGTSNKFINDAPMKLILDEARLMGTERNLNYLHLGGGVGGSDKDSLFTFKSGFSKNKFDFKVWQMIVDEEKYKFLSDGVDKDASPNFFPLYRLKN